MIIMQYMSIQKSPLLYRLLQKTLCQESMIIFDLEDTLGDLDIKKAKRLKAWGRSELALFAHSFPDFFKNKTVGIRANGLKSGEFESDLETIAEISQIWDLHCIVGPKIDSIDSIKEYHSCLKNKDVRYKTFIPIIETVQGMNHLSSIVSHAGIVNAMYGHYDYSLDSGHWPFFEQDEAEFWQPTTFFIQKVEKAGVRYVHPPIAFRCNEELSTQVWLRLQTRCRLPFSIITVNSAQTAFFNRLMNTPLHIPASELRSTSYSLQERIDQARYIKKICSMKNRNFGFDPKTGKFFSPHHYIAALQFLEKSNISNIEIGSCTSSV